MLQMKWFRMIALLVSALRETLCLRNVHAIIPEAVERGSRVELRCLYDLESEELYSVKWYRGDREFCRYNPRDVPPLKIFQIPGIDLDLGSTDAERVTIKSAEDIAGGSYTCEVSADEPSFATAQVHSKMYVVDLPKEGPNIVGLKKRYRPGMKLSVECNIGKSQPPANISFFINSEPAQTERVWHHVESGDNGRMWTAFGSLEFVLHKHHFIGGKIKIRCTAIIYSIYLQSLERVALEERLKPTPASSPDVYETIVHSKHRHRPLKTSRCSPIPAPMLITNVISTLGLILQNVLR